MSTEDNKALVRRFIEEVWNQRNLAIFDELTASNFLFHDPDLPTVRTYEDFKQWIIESLTAFPDLHLTIEEQIAEGDQVVTRWTSRGTHTGDLVKPMPLPATGKQVTISGTDIARFAGGKVIELWHLADALSYMQQLGVIPAPGQAS